MANKHEKRYLMFAMSLSVVVLLPSLSHKAFGQEKNTHLFRPRIQDQPPRALKDLVIRDLPLQIEAAASNSIQEGVDQPIVIGLTNVDFAPEYEWGFVTGLKQTLGAFKDGLSVHQITQSEYTIAPPGGPPFSGNPDHVFWVDEGAGTFGISARPTGRTDGAYVNPGGMVAFGADGTLWYTLGGRAQELPLDLYRSNTPFDPSAFSVVLDDFETQTGSTATTVNVHDSSVMLFWRHRHAGRTDVKVRFQRYDIEKGFDVIQNAALLGTGSVDEQLGPMGIEQVWTRFDPRFNYTFVTWTFFNLRDGVHPLQFGSHPFLYSDDDGDIWRKADGHALVDLPLSYGEIDDVLVPYDHLANRDLTDWQLYSDMGVSPGGIFWMATRTGNFKRENESPIHFFRFNGTQWENEQLTDPMHGTNKSHAVGVTKDYLVLLYSEYTPDHTLRVRLSADDGRTWTPPVEIRSLDAFNTISWISFVQPAEEYGDNAARFFYAYYDKRDPWWAKWWRNSIGWIKIDIDARRGDCDGNGIITVSDIATVMSCMTGPVETTVAIDCQCADLDADGDIDLGNFAVFHNLIVP